MREIWVGSTGSRGAQREPRRSRHTLLLERERPAAAAENDSGWVEREIWDLKGSEWSIFLEGQLLCGGAV